MASGARGWQRQAALHPCKKERGPCTLPPEVSHLRREGFQSLNVDSPGRVRTEGIRPLSTLVLPAGVRGVGVGGHLGGLVFIFTTELRPHSTFPCGYLAGTQLGHSFHLPPTIDPHLGRKVHRQERR